VVIHFRQLYDPYGFDYTLHTFLCQRKGQSIYLLVYKGLCNVIQADLFRTNKEARIKEATGLLHISDRLLAGESSRVEAARGTL